MKAANTSGRFGNWPAIKPTSSKPSSDGPKRPDGQSSPGISWQDPQPARLIAIKPRSFGPIAGSRRVSTGSLHAASAAQAAKATPATMAFQFRCSTLPIPMGTGQLHASFPPDDAFPLQPVRRRLCYGAGVMPSCPDRRSIRRHRRIDCLIRRGRGSAGRLPHLSWAGRRRRRSVGAENSGHGYGISCAAAGLLRGRPT